MELAISIAGVIVAFLVGLFADPIKLYFANRNEREQLRKGLYKEMAFLYERLADFVATSNPPNWETFTKAIQVLATFEMYNYARTKPILFYQLRDASEISQMYVFFSLCFDSSLFNDIASHKHETNTALRTFEKSLLNGELDTGLFLKSCSSKHRQNIKNYLKRLKNSPDSSGVLKNSAS